jgi:cellulose synthase/poly-beta-1,6-N-acetylglucosamine synthase-like glycosyltransferase
MLYGSLKEKHLNKIAFSTAKDFRGFVSVIVPARNEENNIENAIRSIAASNFPTDQFEIIAVNDRSNDGTGDILNKLSDQIPNLKVIHLTEYSKSKNIPGKPGAIDVGIKASRGELIMMTDADCTVNPDWIKTVSLYFTDKDVALVPSFTLIKSKSLFDKIQSLEWLYLHTFASGAIGLNTPMGCYGNNLAVRRSVYDEIGGYEKIKFSVTEDLALLQTIHKTGYKVHYITDFHTSVTTLPVTSFGEYVSQHRRWALGGLSLGWIAAVFVLTTMSMWAGFFISLFIGEIALAFGFIILRVIADFLTYLPAAIELKESRNLIYSPIALPFFIFFELIIPFLMINKTITWKGQKFSKNS